jgi:hypothetical protein
MNIDKRISYTAYKLLQQDFERSAKTDVYGKLLEGFQTVCEGLPMRIKFDDNRKFSLMEKNCISLVNLFEQLKILQSRRVI